MFTRARKSAGGVSAFIDDFGRALEAKRLYNELSNMSEAERQKRGYSGDTLVHDIFNHSFHRD